MKESKRMPTMNLKFHQTKKKMKTCNAATASKLVMSRSVTAMSLLVRNRSKIFIAKSTR